MTLSHRATAFLDVHRSAAMITLRRDGSPHAVRVGVAVVEGKVWSSATADRLRTGHLRRDPRATLFVFGSGHDALTLEGTVRILDGPDAPLLSWKLISVMQESTIGARPAGTLTWFGKHLTKDQFVERMIEERRLVYEFDVTREYGLGD
jgi:hypothetical protein